MPAYTVTCTAVEAEMFTATMAGRGHDIAATYRFESGDSHGVRLTLVDRPGAYQVGDVRVVTITAVEEP